MEVWKIIPDTNEKYMASSNGRIKNFNTNKVLKTRISRGYELVNIQIKGKPKTFTVHRLIAKTFIPNPMNKREINHKDENKLNNALSNLMWCTSKENANWGTRNERISKSITGLQRISVNKVRVIKLDIESNEIIDSYNSVSEAAKLNNIGQSNISDVLRGARKQTGGFAWSYAN